MKFTLALLAAVAQLAYGSVTFVTSSTQCSSINPAIPLPNGDAVCYLPPQDRTCGLRCCDFCWQGKCTCIGNLPEDDCIAIGKQYDVSTIWHGGECACEKSDHMGCCQNSFSVINWDGTVSVLDVCFTETEERNCPSPYRFTCSSYCKCDTCRPASCGNFQPCAQSTLWFPWFRLCYCYTLSDSREGFCARNDWCANYRNCNDVSDCPNPDKDECLINTCCGVGKCVPQNFDSTCFNHQNFLLQDGDIDNADCAQILQFGDTVDEAVSNYMAAMEGPMFDSERVFEDLVNACIDFDHVELARDGDANNEPAKLGK